MRDPPNVRFGVVGLASGGKSVTVVDWLLHSDPSVRWQVMRDLTDASAEEVAAERGRVAVEDSGARLLALQATDGRAADVAHHARGTGSASVARGRESDRRYCRCAL